MRLNSKEGLERQDLGGAMTDISFLLIVFFLVTAVFVSEEGIFSQLPDEDTAPQQETRDKVIQIFLALDSVLINEIVYQDIETANAGIQKLTSEMQKSAENIFAYLVVSDGVPYQRVVLLLSAFKENGISDFTIVSGNQQSNGYSQTSKLFAISVPDDSPSSE